MNHWPFIWAAYAITLLGSLAMLIQSVASMRTAEAKITKGNSDQ
ncbi:MAG: heme exporter protein CcmD [Sphingorhabdus sp.]